MADDGPRPARGVHAICGACAERHGGVWPPGHVATLSGGPCDACGRMAAICSVDDWNWPAGKPRGWGGLGRD